MHEKKLVMSITYTSDGNESQTKINYKGKCTPNQFDRAILSIISTLSKTRDDESSKIGVSSNWIKNDRQKNEENDFSDYLKR